MQCRFLALLVAVAAMSFVARADQPLQFEEHTVISLPDGLYPTCVQVADLDQDGLPDLVITGRNLAGEMMILRGLGGGDFAPPMSLFAGAQTDWVEVRDFDGDGIPDLAVVTRTSAGMMLLYRGRGDGTFAEPEVTPVGRFPTAMAARDLDGSGAIDLVISNSVSDTMEVLRNAGDGTFQSTQTRPLAPGLRRPARPHYFALEDVDGDGIPDIVASHLFGPRVSVLSGRAEGTFSLPRVYRTVQPSSATAADLTGNGSADLVIAELRPAFALLTVYPGDGTGSFAAPASFPVGVFPWWISTADLNADGRVDVIQTDFTLASVAVVRNTSEETLSFAEAELFGAGGFPRMVRAADLTGNCLPDLITIDIAFHQVFIHLNMTLPEGVCPSADLNGDGVVDFVDLLLLFGAWATPGPFGDLTLDGWVGPADLLKLLSAWGTP